MLIVEDGTGRADAESYCSVADADKFHMARGNESAWVDLDTDVKEQYLRAATDYMLQMYRSRWKGCRRIITQALDWPRYSVELSDVGMGPYRAYEKTDIVPALVRDACATLALKAKSGELAPDLKRTVKQKTIGPITTIYADGAPEYVRYRAIDLMLAPYLCGSGTSGRMVRG
jgi:hypothetical protein